MWVHKTCVNQLGMQPKALWECGTNLCSRKKGKWKARYIVVSNVAFFPDD
jgi:hypothetical protein